MDMDAVVEVWMWVEVCIQGGRLHARRQDFADHDEALKSFDAICGLLRRRA